MHAGHEVMAVGVSAKKQRRGCEGGSLLRRRGGRTTRWGRVWG